MEPSKKIEIYQSMQPVDMEQEQQQVDIAGDEGNMETVHFVDRVDLQADSDSLFVPGR